MIMTEKNDAILRAEIEKLEGYPCVRCRNLSGEDPRVCNKHKYCKRWNGWISVRWNEVCGMLKREKGEKWLIKYKGGSHDENNNTRKDTDSVGTE